MKLNSSATYRHMKLIKKWNRRSFSSTTGLSMTLQWLRHLDAIFKRNGAGISITEHGYQQILDGIGGGMDQQDISIVMYLIVKVVRMICTLFAGICMSKLSKDLDSLINKYVWINQDYVCRHICIYRYIFSTKTYTTKRQKWEFYLLLI